MLSAALPLMMGTITAADISITDTHNDRDTSIHVHVPCMYCWDPSELLQFETWQYTPHINI